MLPIVLNHETLSILLIGQGEKLLARKNKLIELGIQNLTVFEKHTTQLPKRKFDIVMIVGFDEETSAELHKQAKEMGALVNVEDNKKYCDFFFQSFVKRGDLMLSVSTNGKTPGTTKVIRDKLEELFPEVWGERIDEIATKREEWKASGKTCEEVNNLTKQYIKDKNWI